MHASFNKEVALRVILKDKGYKFEPENQYWSREWTTNEGKEKILEVAVKSADGEWNKLMMTTNGDIFYAKAIEGEIT